MRKKVWLLLGFISLVFGAGKMACSGSGANTHGSDAGSDADSDADGDGDTTGDAGR